MKYFVKGLIVSVVVLIVFVPLLLITLFQTIGGCDDKDTIEYKVYKHIWNFIGVKD